MAKTLLDSAAFVAVFNRVLRGNDHLVLGAGVLGIWTIPVRRPIVEIISRRYLGSVPGLVLASEEIDAVALLVEIADLGLNRCIPRTRTHLGPLLRTSNIFGNRSWVEPLAITLP